MNIDDNSSTETPVENTQPEFDTSGALADISSDLFGQDDDGNAGAVEPKAGEGVGGVKEVDGNVETPPAPEGEQNSEAVQAAGAPSTWSKEALTEWAAIPPRAQQEILKREEDMFKGIEQYKGAAEIGQKYEAVVEPFRAVLTAENVDPVQLFQSFSANHYLLSRGTPEQKAQLGAQLLTGYGIDLNLLADVLGNTQQVDPRIAQLEQQVQQLSAGVKQQTESQYAVQEAAAAAEVEKFATDPAHPYFNDLVDDIHLFIKAGDDLQTAYDKAVYANPATRQKEIDRLTAEKVAASGTAAQTRLDAQARLKGAEVSTIPKSQNGTVQVGSMDDTLEETLRAIQSRA